MTQPTMPTIMILEADILVRHPLAEYLRECGYRVIEAADTGEARLLLDEGAVALDAILADIRGPGASDPDFAFANWIRSRHPDVEMLLAGTVGRAVEKAGDLCEEGPALAKPYNHALVGERIARLLAARAPRPAAEPEEV